jgi:hypothetical protein
MADDKRPKPDHGLPGKPGDRPERPDQGLPGTPGDRPPRPEQLPSEPDEAEPKRG